MFVFEIACLYIHSLCEHVSIRPNPSAILRDGQTHFASDLELRPKGLQDGSKALQIIQSWYWSHSDVATVGLEPIQGRKDGFGAADWSDGLQVFERLRGLGILMGKGGFHGNVFRIKPPMCFSQADADFVVDALDLALSEL